MSRLQSARDRNRLERVQVLLVFQNLSGGSSVKQEQKHYYLGRKKESKNYILLQLMTEH